MFRKAQLKLFAIITCILLAIFVAVLGSINLIMQAMMQRQSMDVLKKIASGVDYSNNGFVITRPEDFGQKPSEPPPSKPAAEPSSDESSQNTSDETSEETSETDVTSEETSQASQPQQSPAVVQTSPAAPAHTESPEVTTQTPSPEPVTTAPPPEITDAPVQTSAPPATKHIETLPPRPEPTTAHQPTEPPKPTEPYEWWKDPNNWGQMPTYPAPWDGGGGTYPPFYPPYWGGWGNSFSWFGSSAPRNNKEEQPTTDSSYESNTEPTSPTPLALAYTGSGTFLDDSTAFIDDGIHKPPNDKQDQKRNPDNIPKSIGSIDFFIIMADNDGNYLDMMNNDDLDEGTAQNYISAILKEKASSGMLENKYQFYQMKKNNGTLIVFTDKSAEFNMLSKLIRTTIIIGTGSLIFLAAAAYFLSKKIMQPLKSAFEKQKQFVSDASHELKTPLTVISANADVLAGEIGENRWLTYIKSQTDRMNVLVNDLLNLTRLENNSGEFVRRDFDLSKAITNTALPFECQAFESNKKFEVDIEEGLTINGSERHIKQMAAIFIDNALKYSNEGGIVKVGLKKQGDKKVFSIYNTGTGVKAKDKDKIFERFYRSDESRNRATGGYGLGLAIAKSIIDKHKFKVYVDNEEGKSICFIITM